MFPIDLKLLIFMQIGIDIVVIVLFVFFFKKFRGAETQDGMGAAVETVTALLSEADQLALEMKNQLNEKKRLVNRLNEQLDQKATGLKVLLKQTEYVLAEHRRENSAAMGAPPPDETGAKVIRLAGDGCDIQSIAHRLSIPREKVKLLLDMKKNESFSKQKAGTV